jgi:hypothetical protein
VGRGKATCFKWCERNLWRTSLSPAHAHAHAHPHPHPHVTCWHAHMRAFIRPPTLTHVRAMGDCAHGSHARVTSHTPRQIHAVMCTCALTNDWTHTLTNTLLAACCASHTHWPQEHSPTTTLSSELTLPCRVAAYGRRGRAASVITETQQKVLWVQPLSPQLQPLSPPPLPQQQQQILLLLLLPPLCRRALLPRKRWAALPTMDRLWSE